MKKGKIILGTVAVIVTAATSLTMKAANKVSAHRLYYQLATCGCVTVIGAFKHAGGVASTINGSFTLVNGTKVGATMLYTLQTVNKCICQNPTDHYQVIQ